MPNFYTEHPELKFHLNNPMMERICELKERGYRDPTDGWNTLRERNRTSMRW